MKLIVSLETVALNCHVSMVKCKEDLFLESAIIGDFIPVIGRFYGNHNPRDVVWLSNTKNEYDIDGTLSNRNINILRNAVLDLNNYNIRCKK